jgi:hypothetical protein
VLTEAAGRGAAVQQDRLQARHLPNANYRKVRIRALRDAAVPHNEASMQRRREPPRDAAFGLAIDAQRIQGNAAVDHRHDPVDVET